MLCYRGGTLQSINKEIYFAADEHPELGLFNGCDNPSLEGHEVVFSRSWVRG